MKILRLIATALTLVMFASTSQAKNIYDDIKEAEANLPQNKYTLIYQYTSWCGASRMGFDSLISTISKNREKFNFIVITDSLSFKELSTQVKNLNPDAFISYNKYFAKRMNDKKEAKELGEQFAARYDYEYDNYLSSGTLYLEFPNHNLMKLFSAGKASRINNYLESVPVLR